MVLFAINLVSLFYGISEDSETIGMSHLRFLSLLVLLLSTSLPFALLGASPSGLPPQDDASMAVALVHLVSGFSTLVLLSRMRRLPTIHLETIFPAIYVSILVLALIFVLLVRWPYDVGQVALSVIFFGVGMMLLLARIDSPRLKVAVLDPGLVSHLEPFCDVETIDHWQQLRALKVKPDAVVGRFSEFSTDKGLELQRAMLSTQLPYVGLTELLEDLEGKIPVTKIPTLRNISLDRGWGYLHVKRGFDLLFSLLLGVPALLLAPWIALAIRLDSPGPILFVQQRMGYRGKAFWMFKFRSMSVSHEGKGFTEHADEQRITKVGRFLRKTRLDELPQLLNILRGDMSFIGPRPESMTLAKWYCRDVPLFRIRHMVRPGISGWAQVNQGYAAGVEAVTEKVRYDLYYIKNLTIWLDLVVVMKTIIVMLSGRGAR